MSIRGWMAADLAPGDQRARRLDVSGLVLRSIRSVADPAFAPAYRFLAAKFAQSGALESVPVLAQRFGWPDFAQTDGWTLTYEMLSISDAVGEIAAVRDHTAAVLPATEAQERQVIVHLSHVLVAEHWRRSGIGGWLRALPLQLARECLELSGSQKETAITLVAEMEAPSTHAGKQPASLLAYEKAGFRKLDPACLSYVQPDFRPPDEIDRSGGPQPLPFSLVIRQVGRESDAEVSGEQARLLARTLYRIYRDGCRGRDLAPLLTAVGTDYPQPEERIRLVPPSAT